jgi:hypothetical protein
MPFNFLVAAGVAAFASTLPVAATNARAVTPGYCKYGFFSRQRSNMAWRSVRLSLSMLGR